MLFQNREDAGKQLALRLKKFGGYNTLILALPRGGVPVGSQIANYLHIPLDIFVVRKIGAPSNPELAIGAIASGGTWYLDKLTIQNLKIPHELIDEIAIKELEEVARRQKEYRDNLPPPEIKNKTIILVDDGIATGATVKAAIRAIQKNNPAKLILAVPVCSREVIAELNPLVDKIICLETPDHFTAVGVYYKNFDQISDDEVKAILHPK